jgi:nucleoside 2-deoxyribosyltransferase
MEFDDSEFVRDSAEKYVSVREIQNHHLTAIAQSDFVWLHAPKGYVGSSAALEIGFAIAHRIPVFSRHRPSDVTLQEYVRTVSSVYDALSLL